MRIGVEATCWQNTRGYGRHVRSLISALVNLDVENQYTLYMDTLPDEKSVPRAAEIHLVHSVVPAAIAASASGRRSVRDMWLMSRALSGSALDLLLFPAVYSYVPVVSRARKLVMIQDIIAEKYPQLTLPSRGARLAWKAKTTLGRSQADAIVTLSEYSRQGIIEHFRIAPTRVFATDMAADPVFRVLDVPQSTPLLESMGVGRDQRTVAYVGGFGPHKNLEMLVTVFAKLVSRSELSDTRLVMVGEYEKEVFYSQYGAIKQQIERLGISDRVVFTGYLPDEELVILLNLVTVLALPSLMEGFGLPGIEAAACGCPVVATTESPLPELLGGGGLYIDPTQPEDLELKLIRVLTSPGLREQMREAGLAAARRLTWEAAARQMMGVIETVMAR
jgi:glycosyltransferase involved in cell wall biosynthesis